MTLVDVTAGDCRDIGVRILRDLVDADVNVLDTAADGPEDLALSIKDGDTTVEIHFGDETAREIADRLDAIATAEK